MVEKNDIFVIYNLFIFFNRPTNIKLSKEQSENE